MIKKLPLLVALICIYSSNRAQYCTSDNRFTQTPVFSTVQIQEDSLVYATAVDWQGVSQNLKLNVFYPTSSADTYSKRPLILMIFGGAFVSGNRGQMDNYCMEFAQRGFVAVSIDYRLGKETVTPCVDTLSQEKAVYRAIQDAKAAMRYMVANATTYKVDTAWLFAGGYSAGAGTANGMVYNSPVEFQQVYPSIVSSLGDINTSGNALTSTFRIRGIFNNWGGVSSDFFDTDEGVPTVSFHGGNDGVVPIDSAIDVTCFTTNHYIYGSHALYTKLTAVGICGDLTVDLPGGHGVYQGGNGTLMRVNRATCFFKSLFCNSCSNYIATDSVTPNCSNLVLGLKNRGFINTPSIYPNPVTHQLYITMSSTSGFEINLINSLGVPVLKAKNQNTLDVSQLENGIYLIYLKQDHNYYTQKLIKE